MSSDSDVMISVRGLGKAYTIAQGANDRSSTLGEAVMQRIRHPFKREQRETFWALNDVSFDVKRGDVVGVIGRNGAGKSTLFKVLSRITEPTTGEVDLYGRVGSLLEVGTGFSGELTGRENIFLNGTILGMRRSEIAKRFDEIVDFAGVDKFLDTPVKRYSSGMFVRLAFAVAAHLDPEILIVDEVLSVGDAEFQEKCLGRIKEVARGGRTVLFVSHNMPSVKQLCTTSIVLRDGCVAFAGEVEGGIEAYSKISATIPTFRRERRAGSGEYRILSISPAEPTFAPEEEKRFRIRVQRQREATRGLFLIVIIRDAHGNLAVRCDSRLSGIRIDAEDEVEADVTVRSPWLLPGEYTVDCFVDSGAGMVDEWEQSCTFVVSANLPYKSIVPHEATMGTSLLADFTWLRRDAQQSHLLHRIS